MSGCGCKEPEVFHGRTGCAECDKAAEIGAEVIYALEEAVASLQVTASLMHRTWTSAHDRGACKVSLTTKEAEAVAVALDGVRERLEAARGLM